MAARERAKEHMANAEKALKPSWTSFKFSPDHLMASMEYAQAAADFRAASLPAECADAWVKSGQMKELLHDLFGAGRAYESAATISDTIGQESVIRHLEKAIQCFRLAGKADIAAKLLLKMAGIREKQSDFEGAKSAYEDTINVFEQEEKDYELGDVYKTYIGYLIRREALEDALKAMDGHISVLQRQKSLPFVYKELLSKMVLLVKMEDNVRAEELLTSTNIDGWIMSREYQVGTELFEAIKNYDAEALIGLQKDQIFTFLQVEVARIAKQLKVAAMAVPKASGGYAAEKPQPVDIADLLQ